MNIKKITLLTILLLLLVTEVVATDSSNTTINSNLETIDDSQATTTDSMGVHDNIVEQNNKNIKQMDDFPKDYTTTASSYDELVSKVNSAKSSDYDEYTVNLKRGTYSATSGMEWDNTDRAYKLTINANGSTFNGTGDYQFISVSEYYTFELKNAILTNFNAEGGGVIFGDDDSTIIITNCTFNENIAQKNGGAIYTHATLNVSNSTFTGNKALYYGGAIHSYYANVTIKNTTFTNNHAVSDNAGGNAIGNYAGNVSVTNCTFTNNKGIEYANGGAILNEEGYLKVTKSTFTNNSGYNGGAISIYYGDADVTNSTFIDNNANADGGAINNYYGDLNVNESIFVNNKATYGGAIENVGCVYYESYPLDYVGNSKINNNTFLNNTADYGGAISSYVYTEDDSYDDDSNNDGIIITNNILTGNHANIDGGAILIELGNKTTITSNNFDSNTADGKGGAIGYYKNEGYDSSYIVITENIFTNNNASSGGAIHNTADNVNITKNNIIGNYITDNNVIMDEGSNTTVEDNQFEKLYTILTLNTTNPIPELRNNVTFTATLTDERGNKLSNKEITFNIDNEYYIVRTDFNGEATKTYTTTTVKTITVTASYDDSNAYYASTSSINITIIGKYNTNLNLEISNTTPLVNSTITITGILTDENNNKLVNQSVVIETDNNNYTLKTDANGTVTQSYKPTNIGIITITAKYNGDDDYKITSSSAKIFIRSESGVNSKVNTKINFEISNSMPIVNNSITIEVILTDVNDYKIVNEDIILTIDNTDYTLKTNSDGQATQTYTPSTIGNQTINAQYLGNSIYNGNTTSIEISVKDETHPKEGYIYVASMGEGNGSSINNPTNLTYALSIVKNNEVIYLVSNTDNDTYTYSVTINDETVKAGTYNFSIIGQNARTIIFKDTINITDKNITFKNINFIGDAGKCSIANYNGTLTVDNCTFIHNITKSFSSLPMSSIDEMRSAFYIIIGDVGGYKATIYNAGNNSLITNCNFTNNLQVVPELPSQISSINYALNFLGGAIYNIGQNVTISNNIFDGNKVESSSVFQPSNYWWERNEVEGGAIYNAGEKTVIKNNTFRNNTAPYGGAIYNVAGNTTIIENIFINNYASSYGSAIYNNAQQIMITKNTFINSTDDTDLQLRIDENTTATDNIIYYYADYSNIVSSSLMATFEQNNIFICQNSNTTPQLTVTVSIIGEFANITAIITEENETITDINKGKVTFKINGKTIKDVNGKVIYAKVADGTATIENYHVPEDWLKEGTTIQAVYSGSTQCDKLTSEKTEIIIPKELTISTTDIHATAASTITLTATLSDNTLNKGKVVFKINGKTVKDANSKVIYAKVVNGQVSVEYTIPESMKAGNYTITAVYTSPNSEKVTSEATLTVVKA